MLRRYLTTAPSTSSIDPLDSLSTLLQTEPDLAAVILGFIDSLPKRVASISEAWQDKAWDELRRHAHSLINAGLFGFPTLGSLAHSLEVSAKGESTDEVPTLIDAVQESALCAIRTKSKVINVIREQQAQH
jgi:HPt (histidine-containing phosphotransfer) domain-containing protein